MATEMKSRKKSVKITKWKHVNLGPCTGHLNWFLYTEYKRLCKPRDFLPIEMCLLFDLVDSVQQCMRFIWPKWKLIKGENENA